MEPIIVRVFCLHVTGSRDPPPAPCGLYKFFWRHWIMYRAPHKVSTTSEFGTPNGVLRCSMSPQCFLSPHCARGGAGHMWISSFYQTTPLAVPPVSVLILHPREKQIMWSQTGRQRRPKLSRIMNESSYMILVLSKSNANVPGTKESTTSTPANKIYPETTK